MRQACRGGRPRVDDLPEGSMKAFARDVAVLRAYATLRGISLKQAVNLLCCALVRGGTIPPRPELAPDGWRLIR